LHNSQRSRLTPTNQESANFFKSSDISSICNSFEKHSNCCLNHFSTFPVHPRHRNSNHFPSFFIKFNVFSSKSQVSILKPTRFKAYKHNYPPKLLQIFQRNSIWRFCFRCQNIQFQWICVKSSRLSRFCYIKAMRNSETIHGKSKRAQVISIKARSIHHATFSPRSLVTAMTSSSLITIFRWVIARKAPN
jgi:hypothetical protein